MTVNHALVFIMNGPREGQQSKMMEVHNATQAFWNKRKQAGEISSFENVMLASTGNQNMPAGFLLVLGDRAKLQAIRWEDQEFLKLHTLSMMTVQGYACIDGYAGEGFDKHMQRFVDFMKSQS